MKQKELVTIRYAHDLVEGEDYEFVSFIVVDNKDQFQTIESFFSVDQLEFIKQNLTPAEIEKALKTKSLFSRNNEDFKFIKKVDMVKMPVYFYRLNELPLDLDLLVSLGFGLIRMLTDDANGELWFFDALYFRNRFFAEEDEWDDPIIGDTAIRLMIYFSLHLPTYNDRDLERILNMSEDYLKLMCLCNGDAIIERLKEGFARKKGGDNVISFPIKK